MRQIWRSRRGTILPRGHIGPPSAKALLALPCERPALLSLGAQGCSQARGDPLRCWSFGGHPINKHGWEIPLAWRLNMRLRWEIIEVNGGFFHCQEFDYQRYHAGYVRWHGGFTSLWPWLDLRVEIWKTFGWFSKSLENSSHPIHMKYCHFNPLV